LAYGDYGKTTELEAVNICLGSIGEQGVTSIPDSGISKATIARDLLYEFSRQEQSKGLACNKDTEYELTASESEIAVPATAIAIDPSYNCDNRYVERNSKIYDREDQTYTLTIDSLYVDIIWFLEWTLLPEHVRRYITIKAARVFQKRYLSDENLHKFTEIDEYDAKAEFERKELDIEDFSLIDNLNVNPRVYRRRR